MATRRESVVLDLEDRVTPGLLRVAAAAELADRKLKGMGSGSSGAQRALTDTERQATRTSKSLDDGARSIDRYSGRLGLLVTAATAVGPALIPIGGLATGAVAALASDIGSLGLGIGTTVLAFHNMGTALMALNKAALDPTVTNLNAAQLALDALPPAARGFAQELAGLTPALKRAQEAAAEGLFPGLETGLMDLERMLPEVDRLLNRVGSEIGSIAARGAQSLSGPEWEDFRNFVMREAAPALEAMARATGDVIHGLAELLIAFAPFNHEVNGWLMQAAASFDAWATSLGQTQGFQDFLNYLSTEGPKAGEALAAIGNALLAIVEAAAPLAGPVLSALTAVANAIAAIGNSDIGTPIYATIAALAILSRSQQAFGSIAERSWFQALQGATTYGERVAALRGPLIKGGLAIAGLGIAASGVGDKIGLANTATLALTGSLAGPWGAAAGAAVGLFLDMSKSSGDFQLNTADLTSTLNQQTGALTKNTAAYVAQQLQQQGILDQAQKLGLSLQDVTKAALGNQAAQERVTAQAEAARQAAGESAISNLDWAESWGPVRDAINASSSAIDSTTGGIGQINEALGKTSGAFGTAQSAAEAFRNTLDRVNEALTGRQGLRDYQQSLDDFTKSVKENGRSLNIDTQKGRDNQAALDGIAKSALAVAQNMKASNREHFLTQARADFIDAARKLGIGKQAAQDLADKLGLLDNIKSAPTIALNGWQVSIEQARQVAAAINAIKDRTVTITTRHATGGRSTDYFSGGYTGPGGKYEPAGVVHRGEVVIPAEETARDWSMLKSRYGYLPGFASGGVVGSGASANGRAADDATRSLRRLQAALDDAKAALDAERQVRSQLVSTVRDSFRTQFLGVSNGVWSKASDPLSILRQSTHDAREYRRDLARLRKRGISAGVASQITDLASAQSLDGRSSHYLHELNRAYAERQHASASAARDAGRTAYGAQIDRLEMRLHHIQDELRHTRHEAKQNADRTGHAVGKEINNTTGKGTRRARHP